MLKNIEQLNFKFLKIKKMGWIKSLNKGSGSIGYTFEKLIGKKTDDLFFPDFNGIEIKTKRRFSKGFITMLSLNPDGDYLFPIEYLRNTYGYPDKIIKNQKIFNYSITNLEKCIHNHYLFTLKVDYEHEKIVLKIINLNNGSIDSNISWSFQSIKERIFIKLSYLSIVRAMNKYIDGCEYFYYYDISFYKLKGFDEFIKLIENGNIRITFKIGIFKSGDKIGQINNHGTSFDININDIPLLFDNIKL